MRSLDYYAFIGYKRIEGFFGLDHLAHHGIKGQKWGVKNGPPYPLSKDKHDSIVGKGAVEEAIESGKVSKQINPDKQRRHTLSEHIPGRSYLNGNLDYAQELIDKLSGTGIPKMDQNDKWTNKEMVVADNTIGFHVDAKGNETETKAATIVYSKSGSHIFPRKE